MLYHDLDDGELGGMSFELRGDFPLRQFINLTDGEEGFIPFDQIIILEVVKEAIFPEREEDPKTRTDLHVYHQGIDFKKILPHYIPTCEREGMIARMIAA